MQQTLGANALLGSFWVHKAVIKIQCWVWFPNRPSVTWDGQFLTRLRWVQAKAFPNPSQQLGASVAFSQIEQTVLLQFPGSHIRGFSFVCVSQRNTFAMHTYKLFLNTVLQAWHYKLEDSSVRGISWILCIWSRTRLAFTKEHSDVKIRYHFLWGTSCLFACLFFF